MEEEKKIKGLDETDSEQLISDELAAKEIEAEAEKKNNELVDKLFEERRNGYIIYFNGEDFIRCKIENFIKQGADGVLYDLNRDVAITATLLKSKDCTDLPKIRLINDFAMAAILEWLIAERRLMPEVKKDK